MPSQPLLGMPVVVGISAAVMAMRSVSSAAAGVGETREAAKTKTTPGTIARKRRMLMNDFLWLCR